MKKHLLIQFTIKEDSLEKAHSVIRTFVTKVRLYEEGTLVYNSFFESENPRKFSHIMSFQDDSAQQLHRNTPYVKEFVDSLYPLLENGEPAFIPLKELGPS